MSHTAVVTEERPRGLGAGRWLLFLFSIAVSALIWSRPDAQMWTRDLLQAHAPPRAAGPARVVLVTVTESDTGGAPPDEVERTRYARAVEKLALLGASAIGFQPTFTRPAPGDPELAQEISRSRVTVLSHGFSGDPWLERRELVLPVQELGEPAAALGFLALTYDPDAVLRRMHLAFDGPADPGAPPLLPSLPLALSQVHMRTTSAHLTAGELVVTPPAAPALRIPVQPAGDRTAWVMFDPALEFERISLTDLAGDATGLLPKVAGRIALIVDATRGGSFPCAFGAAARRELPWIWAAQTEAVLSGWFLRDLKAWLDPWFFLVFAAIALVVWTPDPRRAVLRVAVLLAIWPALTFVLARRGYLLDGVGLEIITFSTGTLAIFGHAFLERRRSAALERDIDTHVAALAGGVHASSATGAPAPVPAFLEPRFLTRYLPERYERLEFLARGGMGVVYRAWDATLMEPVALKVLDPRWRGDADAVARFLGEIRAAQALDHPSIVRVLDVRRTLVPFLAMELVEGRSLEAMLRDGGAAPELAWRIGERLASALAHVHERRIVHRDVKPSNVIWQSTEEVKLLDFGIARRLDATAMTVTGDVLGSLPYMAPEQLDGRAAAPSADIYSWAVTVMALILGKPLERRGLVHEIPRDVLAARGVPSRRLELFAACCAEDPAQRPRDGAALLARNQPG